MININDGWYVKYENGCITNYMSKKEAEEICYRYNRCHTIDEGSAYLKYDKDFNIEKFYFTFGSDSGFPYQKTYLIVIAETKQEAIRKFREKYPDRHKNTFNCSFVYSEEQWNGSLNQKYYPEEPAEIIE